MLYTYLCASAHLSRKLIFTGEKKLTRRKQKMPTELQSRNNLKREQLEYQETDMGENYTI